jgi:2-C-methyl-D-erythritol 4-phosphate cytidylyltransferase
VGKRFGTEVKKQYLQICGKPLLYYTLKALNRAYAFDEFIIGASPDDFDSLRQHAQLAGLKNYRLTEGGAERYETVYNCLKEVRSDMVLIHDAVRPFVTPELVQSVISAAREQGAAVCGLKVRDTLKKINGGLIEKTVSRDEYLLSHTPQVFKTSVLKKAVENAGEYDIVVTDEAQAMELYGKKVSWVESTPDNIKLTYQSDLQMMEYLIAKYF